jgi:hypothetical protein
MSAVRVRLPPPGNLCLLKMPLCMSPVEEKKDSRTVGAPVKKDFCRGHPIRAKEQARSLTLVDLWCKVFVTRSNKIRLTVDT